MRQILTFLKKEAVLTAAFVAAAVSACFVPPSAAWLDYIDFPVLILLFCLMAVVAGVSRLGVFDWLARRLLLASHSVRGLCLLLVLLCFFSAMVITNDVALLTFVPFTIYVLTLLRQRRNLIYTVTLETVAANLGSACTPVGNPQNLYLYAQYQMGAKDFFSITLPLTAAGLLAVCLLCLFIHQRSISVHSQAPRFTGDCKKLGIYGVLFVLCLGAVFHVLPHVILLGIVLVVLLLIDRPALVQVDYFLLLTFVCFFVFVGNIKAIPAVHHAVSTLVAGREYLCAVLFSQVISNVPAAVMLSAFTGNAAALLAGTNIGGLGTLIGSLASLISFRLYSASKDARPRRYLLTFSLVNFVLLLIFTVGFGLIFGLF